MPVAVTLSTPSSSVVLMLKLGYVPVTVAPPLPVITTVLSYRFVEPSDILSVSRTTTPVCPFTESTSESADDIVKLG